MILAYARCSTDETRQDIERQIKDISRNYEIDVVFQEYISAVKLNRPEYQRMLAMASEGDTIVATEVSRLSRSTKQFVELLDFIKDKCIRLVVGSMIIDCRPNKSVDIMTEATLKIMSVFSELERQMISERVKSGMENAKSKGKVLGRPPVTKDDVPRKFIDTYELYVSGKLNVTDLSKLNGISRTTVYKYIRLLKGERVSDSGESYKQYAIR